MCSQCLADLLAVLVQLRTIAFRTGEFASQKDLAV